MVLCIASQPAFVTDSVEFPEMRYKEIKQEIYRVVQDRVEFPLKS